MTWEAHVRSAFAVMVTCAFPAILWVIWLQFFRSPHGDDDSGVPARLAARGKRVSLLVSCRDRPLKIETTPWPNTVSEEDLVTVLNAALPWWNPPSVPSAFHELKLWGRNAAFTKEMFGVDRTGEFLVTTLLSDK